MLELIHNFSKVTGYKIHTQKSVTEVPGWLPFRYVFILILESFKLSLIPPPLSICIWFWRKHFPRCGQEKHLGSQDVSVVFVNPVQLCFTQHKSLRIKTDSKGKKWNSVLFTSNSNAFYRLRFMALSLLLYISGPTFMFHFQHPR